MAKLEIVNGARGGHTIPLAPVQYVIGSDDASSITIPDPDVEWSHARIYWERDRYWVEDLQSRAGVLVNNRRVLHRALGDADEIQIGAVRLKFVANGGEAAPVPAPTAVAVAADETADIPAPVDAFVVLPEEPVAPAAAPGEAAASDAGAGRVEEPATEPARGEPTEPPTEPISLPEALTPAPAIETKPAAPAPTPAESPEHELARVREENVDLKLRIGALEADCSRKQKGLNLATESFVDQLERAKERIQTFARRHSESEAAARAREEELAALRGAYHELEARSAFRLRDLADRLDGLRRDFEEIERLSRAKGANLQKLVAEVRSGLREPLAPIAGGPAGAAAVAPGGAGDAATQGGGPGGPTAVAAGMSAGALSASGVVRALGEPVGPASGQYTMSGVRRALDEITGPQAAVGAGGGPGAGNTTARRAPTSPAMRAVRPGGMVKAVDATGSAAVAAPTGAAAAASTAGTGAPADAAPAAPTAPVRRAAASDWTKLAAVFLILAGCAFGLFFLAQKAATPAGKKQQTEVTPPLTPPASRSQPIVFNQATGTPAPTPKPTPPAAPKPAPPPQPEAAKTEPTGLIVQPQPAGSPLDDELLGPLRRAHMSRDEKSIEREELALIARGRQILEAIDKAYQEEKQFNVKVSLHFVKLSLEGKAGARDLLQAMRETKDPSEKMRLAFMLAKLKSPEDLPVLEEAAETEQDPMIKKHIIRALGSVGGSRGLQVLTRIAQSSPDRNLRIEAIRGIEERATLDQASAPEASRFLMDLAGAEQDPSIKSIAIRGLSNVGGRDAVPFFSRILETDDRTNNRAEAAKFMQRVGEEQDLAFLQSVYDRERVYYLKQKIKQAIDAIYRRAGKEPPPDPGAAGLPAGTPAVEAPPPGE